MKNNNSSVNKSKKERVSIYFNLKDGYADFEGFVSFIEASDDPKNGLVVHAACLRNKQLLKKPGMKMFAHLFAQKYGDPLSKTSCSSCTRQNNKIYPMEVKDIELLAEGIHRLIRSGAFVSVNLKNITRIFHTVLSTDNWFSSFDAFYQYLHKKGKLYDDTHSDSEFKYGGIPRGPYKKSDN